MKTAEQLRREQLALPPAIPDLQAQLAAIPGVLGVGVGLRVRNGQLTDELAFTVDVVDKLPLSRLPTAHHIPPAFAGVPIDVRCLPAWRMIIDPADEALDVEQSIMKGGASISYDHAETRGTLGCFATLRSDPNVTVLVTDHHTLYIKVADRGLGMRVGQPTISSTRCCRTGVIARAIDGVRGPIADVAIAKLNGKRPFVQLLPGIGKDKNGLNEDKIVGIPDEVEVGGIKTAVLCGETVRKLGRSTGVTEGIVVSINASHPSTHPLTGETVNYSQQIIIQPTKGGVDLRGVINFGLDGDSGAVVINQYNQVVGLLHSAQTLSAQMWGELGTMCAGAALDTSVGNYGSAAPIHVVVDTMKIDIIKSKDINTKRTPGGPVVPSGALVPGMTIVPRPLTDEELARSAVLDTLIEELFTTPLGRKILELYERHGPEARDLLDHDRRTKIAWHRNHGPALAARVMNGLVSLEQPLPQEIEDKPTAEVLRTIASVFIERGSPAFADDGRHYLPLAFDLLGGATTLREVLDRVRRYGDAP